MTIARITQNYEHEIITCSPADTMQQAAEIMAKHRIGALPVLSDDPDSSGVAGIFSERDLLYRIAKEGAQALNRPIAEVMTAPAITVDPSTTADEALALMTRRRIRHLPVVENGKLTGFVSIGDIVKFRVQSIEQEAEHMREYINQ